MVGKSKRRRTRDVEVQVKGFDWYTDGRSRGGEAEKEM